MASEFYAEMKAVADELIGDPELGQPIVLTREARDVDLESWEESQGPTASDAAQSISGLQGIRRTLDKEALALQTIEMQLGQWVFQAADAIPEEIDTTWSMVTGGVSYPIIQVRPVAPGTLLLLYFAVVQI